MEERADRTPDGKYETYRAIDGWFAERGDSYQIHWAPREILFRGELSKQDADGTQAIELALQPHGATCEFETIDDQLYLNARLNTAPPYRPNYGLHVALFCITFSFVIICGATGLGDFRNFSHILELAVRSLLDAFYGLEGASSQRMLMFLTEGVCFAAPFLLIITCHEFGHYFAARRYRMTVTPPFYIPAPIGIGTFGAMIALRSPMVHRRAVFDVGVAGPLAGFIVALPIFWYGITLSDVEPLTDYTGRGLIQEGKSLLYLAILWLQKGGIPEGSDIMLHPVAWAGWVGLFITALNLIPVGQLDGGHVAYSMFGERHRWIARACYAALLLLTIFFHGYILFAILLYFLIRLDHPPAVDERIELDPARRALGWLTLAIFALTFVPIPLQMIVVGQ